MATADLLRAAAALLTEQSRQQEAWQPIETAPKDYTEILLWQPNSNVYTGRYFSDGLRLRYGMFGEGWYWAGYSEKPTGPVQPTHWMPLPAPPQPKDEDESA